MRTACMVIITICILWCSNVFAMTYSDVRAKYDINTPPTGFKEYCKKHANPEPKTCAVRLSFALKSVKKDFFDGSSFKAGESWNGLVTKAAVLSIVLNRELGKATLVKKKADIKDKKGLIFFDTITGANVTGHISMWNGNNVVDNGDYFSNSPRVYFWPLP